MKKNILFLLICLIYSIGFSDWQETAGRFTEVDRDSGYKGPAAMQAFLDRAEGSVQRETGRWSQFTDDPAAFLEESGLGLTVFLILLGGLALNLTPCVLPMIPVNIAIIGAGAQSETRAKGFALGGTYGLGIASVYGVLGLVAVLGGTGFGALNANPWFNIGIAIVFAVLALSMFGIIHIDFSKFQAGKQAQFKSKFGTAFFMGGIAALLAGACVAPVVLAVLLLAGNLVAQGTPAGLLLPFLLGVGMALPWPFAGAGFTFLPKPGKWMDGVKVVFGVLILLLAVYYGKLGVDLLRPAAGNASATADVREQLRAAHAAGDPVLLYFSAEWCKNCKQMEADTWPDPDVQKRLEAYRFVKVDATDYDQPPAADILEAFNIAGLPTYVILYPDDD